MEGTSLAGPTWAKGEMCGNGAVSAITLLSLDLMILVEFARVRDTLDLLLPILDLPVGIASRIAGRDAEP